MSFAFREKFIACKWYHAVRLHWWSYSLVLIHVRGKPFQKLLVQGADMINTAKVDSQFRVLETDGIGLEKGMRQKTFAAAFHEIE